MTTIIVDKETIADIKTALVAPPVPRRTYELDLKVGADSLDDLIRYLHSLQIELLRGMISSGVSGGYSAGAVYTLSVDESITHDSWAEANERYVEYLRQRDGTPA